MSAAAGKGRKRGPRTFSLKARKSKVGTKNLGSPVAPGATFAEWVESLPNVLAARSLRELAAAIASAKRRKRPVVAGLGAHVIKCGLSPLLVSLVEEGIVTAVAMNGAGAIHDFELAWAGSTSEDVGPALEEGTFGMARETASFVNDAAARAYREKTGFGEALGRLAVERGLPDIGPSILAAASRAGVPVTVHVAIGTDITHMHPSASGAALGEASLADFHLLAGIVERLEGGVYLNIGSAVVLPEVFLKALALARNRREGRPRRFVTADLDFHSHYRPLRNVVCRPTSAGGRGYQIIGHHEINVPLLFAAVREALRQA